MYRLFTYCLFAILIIPSSSVVVKAADLTIIVAGIEKSEGIIEVRLFEGREGWLKSKHPSTRIKRLNAGSSTNKSISVSFRDLISGEYGISVFHDENMNGEIDRGLFSPKEGWGLSNNIKPKLSMPSYKKGRIIVPEEGLVTSILLEYPN